MTQQTTADTLRKAKALIGDPVNWNKDGDYAKEGNFHSGCFCIFGSIAKVTGQYAPDAESEFTKYLKPVLPDKVVWITDYNDHPDTTHDDIMALFDLAIELAEKECV